MKYPYYESDKHRFFIDHNYLSHYYPAHFHSFIEIAYCFGGSQTMKIDGEVYELNAGDAVLIFPFISHEYIYIKDSDSRTESLAIMCNIDALLRDFPILLKYRPKDPMIRAASISEEAKRAFSKILETEDMMSQIGFTYIITSDLLRSVELTETKSNGHQSIATTIATYIDDNFASPLTIEDLASRFSYSPSYIAHIFSDKLKIPFRTYLNSVRCEHASKLISGSEKSLTEIAYESGFNSLNTFCRAFKINFGVTPSQYKKKIKNRS